MERIKYQAEEFNMFEKIYTLNQNDISDYISKHKNFINENPQGYGLWIWKPKVILYTLDKLNNNDILVYCDTGIFLNKNGLERFNYYVEKLKDEQYSMLNFCLNDKYVAQSYVKKDAIMAYNPEFSKNKDKYCYAGVSMIKKNDKSIALIKDWLELCENYDFLNKNNSIINEEDSGYIGNDCDNGLFNLCLRKHNISYYVYPDETNIYTNDGDQDYNCLDWSSLDKYPFQYRRIILHKDLVSVIIPTYNRYKYLINAIESIKTQTYKNIEIIVINDASTQNEYYTRELIDKDTKVIHLPKKIAVGHVRNKGCLMSSGKYLAFLDDDDSWLPHKLELQMHYLKLSNCKMASTDGYIGDGPYDKNKNYKKHLTEYYYDILKNCYIENGLDFKEYPIKWHISFCSIQNSIICSSVLVEKKVIEKIGYFTDMQRAQDYECWKKVLEHTDNLFIREPCVYYDKNHGDGSNH
jgi:hypothetical protein